MNMSSASPQAENQVDGAARLDVVVGQFITILQVLAFVAQPELVNGHRLSVVDPVPEVADRLVGFDIVWLSRPIPHHEHLDGHRLGDQQRHPGAGLQAVGAERPGVVGERSPLRVLQQQLLPADRAALGPADERLQRAHGGLWLHRQGVGLAPKSDDEYFHAEGCLKTIQNILKINFF